jgi:ATP-dependent Lhr-like helicase
MEALLDAIGILQGAALPASELEREILPARVANYAPADLDTLMAAGEVVWVGVERVGERDGRIALYLTENLPHLLPPRTSDPTLSERARFVLAFLERSGASFFADLHNAAGGGFAGESLDALWELVWGGLVTNDAVHPLRAFLRRADDDRHRAVSSDGRPGSPDFLRRFRARSGAGSSSQGRWSLVSSRAVVASPTEWVASIAQQLLVRYGVVSREAAAAESIAGGYSAIYPALRTMEESGWIRRGMFVAGMGAAQFAMSSAVEMLRSLRNDPENVEAVHLASTDPANPYGALLPWPRLDGETPETPHGMARVSGASVVIVNGRLAAFLRRRNPALRVFLPDEEPDRGRYARELAKKLAEVALKRQSRRSGVLISEINGHAARDHFLSSYLLDAGFVDTALGFQMRRTTATAMPAPQETAEADETEEETTESA